MENNQTIEEYRKFINTLLHHAIISYKEGTMTFKEFVYRSDKYNSILENLE